MPLTLDLLWLTLALLGAGVISGFFAGFFGVGGGAPVVFALYETFRIVGVPAEVRMHMSVGTALAVMIPTALVSYLAHRKRGSVDERMVRAWALPVVLGVVAGSFVAAVANQIFLKFVFAGLAALTGIKMLSSRMTWRLKSDDPSLPATYAAGLLTGLLSSLMGIGGGVFGNMFLSLYGRPMHQIVGTSASLGVLIAVPGMIGYMVAGLPYSALTPPASIGYVSLLATLIVAPIAAVSAPLGVRVAHAFTPQQLKRAFGYFLLVLSARFWVSILVGI
ncbi:MAG TPA: sulfite exporter TauE/SafE family protein [Beijerinckiaceae bacterium]